MESRLSQTELYYLLGFGFSEFTKTDKLVLTKDKTHLPAMKDISYRLFNQYRVKNEKDTVSIVIDDPDTVKFITEGGVLTPKKYVPSMSSAMKPVFAAGYFEGYGNFTPSDTPRLFVKVNNIEVAKLLSEQWNIEPSSPVTINGYKALDICGNISAHTPYQGSPKMSLFWDCLNLQTETSELKNKKFYYHKLSPKAVAPQKFRVTDSGHDLHVVELTKLYTTYFGGEVYRAKTELAVKPVFGQAFDIAGRSSLPEKGWQFLQGVGICDRSYTNGVQATLMKLSSEPLPELPWRCLQLVSRQAPIHLPFEERRDLGDSDRGNGGFGSTEGRKPLKG